MSLSAEERGGRPIPSDRMSTTAVPYGRLNLFSHTNDLVVLDPYISLEESGLRYVFLYLISFFFSISLDTLQYSWIYRSTSQLVVADPDHWLLPKHQQATRYFCDFAHAGVDVFALGAHEQGIVEFWHHARSLPLIG